MKKKAPSRDIYQEITDKIVAAFEKGTRPWIKPWSGDHAAGRINRPLRYNFEPYTGVNVLNLWLEADLQGFTSPVWMTYRQAQTLGGQVRKGEHGSTTVRAGTFIKTEQNAAGEDVERALRFLKHFTVFNVEQIDDLPEKYYARTEEPVVTEQERLEIADLFFANTQAKIQHGGNRAFYSPTHDKVQMPPFEAFKDSESYYATLAHEITHWTKHKDRLDRDFGRKKWGDEGYAMEELVAELGAAFLSADLHITPEVREDHASYISSWLKVLKDDKKAIFTAAAHAQRAADLLHSFQTKEG